MLTPRFPLRAYKHLYFSDHRTMKDGPVMSGIAALIDDPAMRRARVCYTRLAKKSGAAHCRITPGV